MLSLKLPEWLVNLWAVYGEVIMPILITILSAIVTWMALKIKTDAKLRLAQAEAQLNALESVAENSDNNEIIKEQNAKIEILQTSLNYISEMLFVAFKNSNLDPEIKSNLEALSNKVKYGTTEDLVAELEAQKQKLEEQLAELSKQVTSAVVETVSNEVNKRVRR